MSATGHEPEDPQRVDVLARVRRVVETRRAAGDPSPAPQSFVPAEPVEGSDFFPWRKPGAGAALVPPGTIAVNILLELPPERFVVRLHHAVVGRDPSDAELARWVARVSRHSWQRVIAVVAVRLSREGRARGLRMRVRWAPFARLVVGAVLTRLRARRFRA